MGHCTHTQITACLCNNLNRELFNICLILYDVAMVCVNHIQNDWIRLLDWLVNSYGQIGGAVRPHLFQSRYAPHYGISFGIAMRFVFICISITLLT